MSNKIDTNIHIEPRLVDTHPISRWSLEEAQMPALETILVDLANARQVILSGWVWP